MMNGNRPLHCWLALLMMISSAARLTAAPYYGEIRQVGVTAPAPPFGESVASFNTRLWSVSADGLRWSPDGNRWTDVATTLPLANRDLSLVAFEGRLWLIGGELGFLSTAGPSSPRGTTIWSSANGTSWRLETDAPAFPPRHDPTILQHEGALWLMGGFTEAAVTNYTTTHTYLNDIWRTTNGTDWTTVTTAAPWSPRAGMAGAVHWGKMWLIGGSATEANAEIWFSSNGADWAQISEFPTGPIFGGAAVGLGRYLYLVTAGDRTVWRSFNGREWRRLTNAAPWPARFAPALLLHDGGMALVGGHPVDPAVGRGEPFSTWKSFDGRSWLRAGTGDSPRWSPRWLHEMAVYDPDGAGARMWIIGGHFYRNGIPAGDVWSSADGRHWSLATDSPPWGARWGHRVDVSSSGLKIYGGRDGSRYYNDIWTSVDGVHWTSETLNAAWAPRAFHAPGPLGGENRMDLGVDFGDEWIGGNRQTINAAWGARAGHESINAFLMGGTTIDGNYLNDVWMRQAEPYSSPTAYEWVFLGNAPWSPRRDFNTFHWNNRTWIAGGFGPEGFLGDVWFSYDGKNWHRETYAETMPPRRGAGACVFRGNVWITGGLGPEGPLNDIWTSEGSSGASLEWTKY